MSVYVMSQVFKRYPCGGGEMLLALALADYSNDEGESIFPSVAVLARKTRQSERAVQYQLRKMETKGWLILVRHAEGGRGHTREYKINESWINGAEFYLDESTDSPPEEQGENIAPIDNHKGRKPQQERAQSATEKGAIAIAPESSLIIKEPSGVNIRAERATTKRRVPEDYKPPKPIWEKYLFIEDLDLKTKRFINHHIARDSRFADIDRAWVNWVTDRFVRKPKPPERHSGLGGRLAL